MEGIKTNAKEGIVKVFKNQNIDEYTRNFIEDLIEGMENAKGYEEYGDSIEYYDEYGTTLFVIELSDEDECVFRFYENSYTISVKILNKILEIMK